MHHFHAPPPEAALRINRERKAGRPTGPLTSIRRLTHALAAAAGMTRNGDPSTDFSTASNGPKRTVSCSTPVIRWEVQSPKPGTSRKHSSRTRSRQRRRPPVLIHADNGTSMTSKPVSQLLADLNITDSHSRPHVRRQPVFRGALQDAEVLPGLPRHLRVRQATPERSASFSSITTTTSTAIPESACTPARYPQQQLAGNPQTPPGSPQRRLRRPPGPLPRPPAAGPSPTTRAWINKPRPTIESQETAGINQAA